MSLEYTLPPTRYRDDTDDEPSDATFVILWCWNDGSAFGVADWFVAKGEAEHALSVLERHGDPSKKFKLEVL
jgi:hypothetical protein